MQQAYFAVMGGFAVNSSSFWTKSHITFTPGGILTLAKLGLLPSMSLEAIQDKSKADAIAKVLVCLQVGWFLLQSLVRVIRHLPLTLLELHTIIHIFCAFVMYLIWFQKPYNVGYPQICFDQRIIDIAAFFALSRKRQPEEFTLELQLPTSYHSCQQDIVGLEQVRAAQPKTSPTNPKLRQHLVLANRAILYLKKKGSDFSWGMSDDGILSFDNEYTVFARSNLWIEGPLRPVDQSQTPAGRRNIRKMHLGFLISSVYGAAHLGAWGAHFPTIIELWMWRASGITLVSCPIAWQVYMFCIDAEVDLGRPSSDSSTKARRSKVLKAILFDISCLVAIVAITVLAVYPVARLFIIAESLASLRACPTGTFETVEWADMIPHAS